MSSPGTTSLLRCSGLVVTTLVLALQLACQEPFGTDRHDLVGDRVAGIEGDLDGEVLRPRALLVSGGELFQDEAVELAWTWLDAEDPDVDAMDPDQADATGPWPELERPENAAVLGLVARFPSGADKRAIWRLGEGGPTPLPRPTRISTEVVTGLDSIAAAPEDLEREARLARSARPAVWLPITRWARLTLNFAAGEPPSELTRTRWMSLAGAGTFLELDLTRTDWSPAHLVFDDLEIDEAEPLSAGLGTFLALALDDSGGTRSRAQDVWLDQDPEPGLMVGGRWLPGEAVLLAEHTHARFTLVSSEASTVGLAATAITGLTLDDLSADDPYGTEALPCRVEVSGPFDPTWLLDGRCLRGDVDGATVVALVER